MGFFLLWGEPGNEGLLRQIKALKSFCLILNQEELASKDTKMHAKWPGLLRKVLLSYSLQSQNMHKNHPSE